MCSHHVSIPTFIMDLFIMCLVFTNNSTGIIWRKNTFLWPFTYFITDNDITELLYADVVVVENKT